MSKLLGPNPCLSIILNKIIFNQLIFYICEQIEIFSLIFKNKSVDHGLQNVFFIKHTDKPFPKTATKRGFSTLADKTQTSKLPIDCNTALCFSVHYKKEHSPFLSIETITSKNLAMAEEEQAARERRIAVAVDESEESMYALTWCLENVVSPKDIVFLVHARSPPTVYTAFDGTGYMFSSELVVAMERYGKQVADSVVEKAVKICRGHAGVSAFLDHSNTSNNKFIIFTGIKYKLSMCSHC